METVSLCLCCLSGPPDKCLKTPYTVAGKNEIYTDMLKECFEIHINYKNNNGICDKCIKRLRDAFSFKCQVLDCQTNLKNLIAAIEQPSTVKMETNSDDEQDSDGIYLVLKGETGIDSIMSEMDNKNLATVINMDEMKSTAAVKPRRKIHGKKKTRIKDDISVDNIKAEMDDENLEAVLTMDETKSNDAVQPRRKIHGLKNTSKPRKILKLDEQSEIMLARNNEYLQHQANTEAILKNSNCIPFSNRNLNGFLCGYCTSSFPDPKDLRLHTHKEHANDLFNPRIPDKTNITVKLDITDLKCTNCYLPMKNIATLREHLVTEHGVSFYPDVLDYVLEFKLTNTEILYCCLCDSRYETFKMLLQHMNGHYRNFVCDECNLGFITSHKLRNHKRRHHELGTFKCSSCDKIFSTQVRLMCHEKYIHNTSTYRYTTPCPHCDETFTNYYSRNRHLLTEHKISSATYICNACDLSFILKSKLTSHIKKVHLMERNHICTECGEGFFMKQYLMDHMIKHSSEKIHECTVCHKAYSRKKTLREHMRIHDNDRRFKCGVCNMSFVQKCSLKSHMLSNHGIALSVYEKKIKSDDEKISTFV